VSTQTSGLPFAEDRERLNDTRDQLMNHIAELPNVARVSVHPAAAGVFVIEYTDRPKVVVDLWHKVEHLAGQDELASTRDLLVDAITGYDECDAGAIEDEPGQLGARINGHTYRIILIPTLDA